jgi:predicted TIM-barrel fold metal-dependent hydrolase
VEINDLILVSVDDHVIEPPTMFDAHLPDAYKDQAPKVVEIEGGAEIWLWGDLKLATMGLNAVAGTPPEEYGIDPTRFDQMRTGCWDIHERIKDMDACGVLGSMCFPTMARFCGQSFLDKSHTDAKLAEVCLYAYNDWHVDEWCGTYPGRFIPLGVVPLWDPNLMAVEVKRLATKGCHAVTFSENPEKLGLPSLHSDHWDPFWAACVEVGTVVCLHIGSSSAVPIASTNAPIDVSITLTPLNSFMALTDLLFCPALTKFPGLQIALSEGGIGWVPYLIERADYVYSHHRAWTHTTLGDRKPSDRFREHITTCFIDDEAGLQVLDLIGAERVTWEMDYPHSDSTWPNAAETLFPRLAGLSDEVINKITHENAMRIFNYDAFSHIPRGEANVGALRARAIGHDVAPRPMNRTHNVDPGVLLAAGAATKGK